MYFNFKKGNINISFQISKKVVITVIKVLIINAIKDAFIN